MATDTAHTGETMSSGITSNIEATTHVTVVAAAADPPTQQETESSTAQAQAAAYTLTDDHGATALHYHVNNVDMLDPMQQGRFVSPKRGHKCCGGCCDVRRAVIVVNLIWGAVLLSNLDGWIKAMKAWEDETFWENYSPRAMMMDIFGLTMVAMGIFGAWRFNLYLVCVTGVYYSGASLLQFLYLIAYANVLPALIVWWIGMMIGFAFFAYPHFVLVSEIGHGILTEETYEREKQSCCCV